MSARQGASSDSKVRLGLVTTAVLLGLSPLLAGWVALARAQDSSGGAVYRIEVRSLDPLPRVDRGIYLPRGHALLLRRSKAVPWSVLVRLGGSGTRVIRVVKPLRPFEVGWELKGTAEPMDISWPTLSVARRRMELETTGYDPGPQDNSRAWVGTTRMGWRARYGIVAVDPSVIPLGTRVYVEGYGPGLAEDVGGAIKGRRMDLCFNNSSEARAWGRRRSRVWIVDPAPRAVREVMRRALAAL